MRKINIYLILILLPILFSCTEVIDNSDLPFTEEMVIRGVIESGEPIKGISIIHTLPALDSFDINKAMINDAVVTITVDNQKINLKNVGFGLYDSDSLIATSGKTYLLEVSWNNKKCNAITTVPYQQEIEKITKAITTKNKRNQLWRVGLNARTEINDNVACVGGFEYIDSLGDQVLPVTYISKAYRNSDTGSTGKTQVNVFQADVPDTNNVVYDYDNFKLWVFIESYDIQFFDYFKTRSNGESIASLFGFTSSEVIWNIKGDGIGLFVGKAKNKKRYNG